MTLAAPKVSTRERLLEATLELLAEGGYAAASVAAITSRAGVASGTLYRHFASKEELFVELFREMCSREVAAMREAASVAPDPLAKLDAALETFARRALTQPRVAWALLAEPVDSLVDAERLVYRLRYRDLVVQILDEASASGQMGGKDTRTLAAAIVGGVGEALVGPLASPPASKRAETELIDTLRDFARRAVSD